MIGQALINSPFCILAVDPGKSGAVCRLGRGQLEVRRDFKSLQQVAGAIKELSEGVTHAVMELVHAMPGQGVCSMFSFGRAAGAADGALALALPEIVVEEVTPQAWQGFFREQLGQAFERVRGRKKWLEEFDSRAIAGKLFPSFSHFLKRKLDHNTADALLMATWKACQLKP